MSSAIILDNDCYFALTLGPKNPLDSARTFLQSLSALTGKRTIRGPDQKFVSTTKGFGRDHQLCKIWMGHAGSIKTTTNLVCYPKFDPHRPHDDLWNRWHLSNLFIISSKIRPSGSSICSHIPLLFTELMGY